MVEWIEVLVFEGAYLGVKVADAADRALSLLPPYKLWRDLWLDSILGPAESFEYSRTTAPTDTPPAIS